MDLAAIVRMSLGTLVASTSARRRVLGPMVSMLVAGCANTARPVAEETSAHVVSSAPVEMNDVSVLFPLADHADEADGYLAAWDDGRGGKLFPQLTYTSGTSIPDFVAEMTVGKPLSAPSFEPGLDYGGLRMVSFRVDPCAGVAGPISEPDSCQNQLRIVFQPLYLDPIAVAATDDGVHASYSLTREELVSLVGELTNLRQAQGADDDRGPLRVHPLLAMQGLHGPYAKGLRAIVTKYAGQQNLTRFTRFVGGSSHSSWTFESYVVAADGRATPTSIPTLDPSIFGDTFAVPGPRDLESNGTLSTTSSDNIQLLVTRSKAMVARETDQRKAFGAAVRVLNPDVHSSATIDCVSCHLAGPAASLTGGALGLSMEASPDVFSADPAFISAEQMRSVTPVRPDKDLNVHMLGYLVRDPMIATRVINETAAVVTYLNGTVISPPEKCWHGRSDATLMSSLRQIGIAVRSLTR